MKTRKIISISGVFLILAGFVFSGAICAKPVVMPDKITLNYWRIFDDSDSLSDIVALYQEQYPYIEINYKKFRYEEYEDALIEAWAKDEGPDMFAVPNSWVSKYKQYASSLPAYTEVQLVESSATYGKEEITIQPQRKSSYTSRELGTYYVDVVVDDVIIDGEIYGLPYSVDTLVLYYNKNILNQANIAIPPRTWEEFIIDISRLTLLDQGGNIIQSGASLGGTNNVPRAADILTLLIMQSGAEMIDASGNTVTFNRESGNQPDYFPAQRALQFYTDFASPSKEVYSWNEDMSDALSLFSQGNLAFFFGYSYHQPQIRAEAGAGVKYAISEMPQINLDNEINYANYLVEMVSTKSGHQNEAWDFIKFAAHQENVVSYLEKTSKPTALRSLINSQLEDFDLKTFTSQILTAKSWYHGREPVEAEGAILNMISYVLSGEATIKEAVDLVAQQIQTTL